MRTWLPHPNFACSAAVLERTQLAQQRTDCAQLISALRGQSVRGEPPGPERELYASEEVTQMWLGYLPALALYTSCVLREWERRGYPSSAVVPYDLDEDHEYVVEASHHLSGELPPASEIVMPPWLGLEDFHAEHRRELGL